MLKKTSLILDRYSILQKKKKIGFFITKNKNKRTKIESEEKIGTFFFNLALFIQHILGKMP
jgi:hypothetical protein